MGEHKGWRVRQDKASGKWRGEVLIAGTGKYRSRTWGTAALARKWAQAEASGVTLGRSSALVATGRALVKDLARDYLTNLTARGRSPSHLANVRRTLDGLAEVAPDLAMPEAGGAIERWLDSQVQRKESPLSPASRNRMLVETRALCRWAIRRDLLDRDPTRAIDAGSVPDYLRPQFTVAELVTLLAQPTPFPGMHRRFALMVYAGLRAGEAAGLRWGDIDFASRVIVVQSHGHRIKRGKERIVPLQAGLADLLGSPGDPGAVVASLLDSNDRRGFVGLLTACGVPVAGRSPHACRHTYAGIMTATGLPGPLLSAYLGHGSAATTMLYTKLSARYAQDPTVATWPRGVLHLQS